MVSVFRVYRKANCASRSAIKSRLGMIERNVKNSLRRYVTATFVAILKDLTIKEATSFVECSGKDVSQQLQSLTAGLLA
jgi:hypothetical protein